MVGWCAVQDCPDKPGDRSMARDPTIFALLDGCMVRRAGFEPATSAFVVQRSVPTELTARVVGALWLPRKDFPRRRGIPCMDADP